MRWMCRAMDCGSVATDPPGPYIYNEVVALIAVPAWNWRFLGWSHEADYDPATS